MKRLIKLLSRALIAGSLAAPLALAQSTPDCGSNYTVLTATGTTSSIGNLGNTRCTAWVVTYYSEGFSAVSVSFQTAPDSSGTPGSFTAVGSGSITAGTNPMTSTSQSFLIASTYAPWLNVAATLTGTGSISIKVDGWRDVSNVAASGGGGGGGGGNVNLTEIASTAVVQPGVNGALGVGGLAANGSAVAGNPNLIAGSDGTDARTLHTDTQGDISLICSNPATITNSFTSLSASGAQQIIAGSAGKKTYVCKRYVTTASGETFIWTSASAGSCGGTVATVDEQISATAVALDDDGAFVVGSGLNLCINPSASQAATLFLAYVQF